MEDTAVSIIKDMFELKNHIHSLIHVLQEQALTVVTMSEGFPGKLVLNGQIITPILDPITGEHVPKAMTWKTQIATHEGLYQDTYLGFQQAIDRGFN